MAWWGRIAGGALGFSVGGPIGAILGYYIGSKFDKGFSRTGERQDGFDDNFGLGSQNEKRQAAFYTATFSVLGYISKIDGYVSPNEINYAKSVMNHMSLNKEQREVAVGIFRFGKNPDFIVEDVVQQFAREFGNRKTLKQMFLTIQIGGAMSDGQVDEVERIELQKIAQILGFSAQEFRNIFESTVSEEHVTSGRSQTSLVEDYKILGLNENAGPDEVKRAYRKKMSQLHPDKLVSKGLPEEMVDLATEKTKQIRAAYDRIRQSQRSRASA